jgi:hypothetical protein
VKINSNRVLLVIGLSVTSMLFSGLSSPAKAGYVDTDSVYRGGICTEELFRNGSGVTIDSKGNMTGVSVNVAPGKTAEEATASLRNKKVGVSTVGAVKKAGGTVVASPTTNNAYHALMSGITPATAESLFKPSVIPNPSQQCGK